MAPAFSGVWEMLVEIQTVMTIPTFLIIIVQVFDKALPRLDSWHTPCNVLHRHTIMLLYVKYILED